jgi:hypothetical protein
MTKYKWVIAQLYTAPSEDGLTDVVKTVYWRYYSTEINNNKIYEACIYGAMNCTTPSETDFTAYADLTENQVISWIEAGNDVDALKANLDSQIENQKNPPIVNLPLPWAE